MDRCMTESLCCTPETNTTLLINYTQYIKKKKDTVDHVAMGQPGEGKRRGMAWGNPVR